MKNSMKTMICIATGLLIIGLIIISVGSFVIERQINQASSTSYSESYRISEITDITVDSDSLNIKSHYIDGNELTLDWNEAIDPQCEIINHNGKLIITSRNELIWIDLIIPKFVDERFYTLEIGIPADYSGSLSITTGSGEVIAENISAGANISISAGSGKLELYDISAGRDLTLAVSSGRLDAKKVRSGGSVTIESGSGKIDVNQITLDGSFSAKGSSGAIDIKDINGATTVDISASSGNITFSEINTDKLTAETSSGKIRFDSIFAEKSIFLEANSGDIDGSIEDSASNYSINSSTFSGKNNLPTNISIGEKTLKVETGSGDIDIIFLK